MAKTPTQKVITKKHLARMEREQMQNRYILIASIIIFLFVIGIVTYGILDQTVLKNIQPVAKVGSDTIRLSDFYARVRFTRNQQVETFRQNAQYAQFFGNDANFMQSLTNISTRLADPTAFGQTVMDDMIDNVLIRHEAAKMGITVTKADLDKAFQEAFGYYPNGTPSPSPTSTLINTSTLSPLQETLVGSTTLSASQIAELSATPTATLTLTPSLTPTGTLTPPLPTATLAPSGTPTLTETVTPTGPTPTLTSTPNYTATPTAVGTATTTPTPYTYAGYQNLVKTQMSQFKTITINESDLRKVIEDGLYRQRVMDKVLAGLKQEEDQVWARHILVSDENLANEIEQRLKNGESFYFLAQKYSIDTGSKAQGGDLGWFGKGKMVAAFEDAAFALKNVGDISAPVKSDFGYHIIQLLGHENRPLFTSDFETYRQTKFTDWVTQLRKDHAKEITQYSNWTKDVPSQPSLTDTDLQILQGGSSNQSLPSQSQP